MCIRDSSPPTCGAQRTTTPSAPSGCRSRSGPFAGTNGPTLCTGSVSCLKKIGANSQWSDSFGRGCGRVLQFRSTLWFFAICISSARLIEGSHGSSTGTIHPGRDASGAALSRSSALASRPVSYTHLRAHETPEHLVCRLLLEKKKKKKKRRIKM
eukprot:TRINITY_DN13592_c0_g1_i3.p1 TRINITY_DN13592_c0_g1~~TRINITY_DN13592_c0_g1_i3.p1  ORF type:complete len:155 (+),score=26.40 TRINITY_DN13592_c0_g1_i3:168-632(+)